MKNKQIAIIAVVLIAFASLSRLVSHPMNFTPVTALILFSVYAFEGKWKFIVPMLAIIMSDVLLEMTSGFGFHNGTWMVYLSYVVIGIVGFYFIKEGKIKSITASSLTSSLSFFLITNFALFYPTSSAEGGIQAYSHDLSGVIGSYTAGIPFFRNMLIGDLFYSALIFGAFFVIKKWVLKPSIVQ